MSTRAIEGATEYVFCVLQECLRSTKNESGQPFNGECGLIISIEPLCSGAAKKYDMRVGGLNLDQRYDIFGSFVGDEANTMAYAINQLYACYQNTHMGISATSYRADRAPTARNRRGCVSCLEKSRNLFGRNKPWMRYYVSVYLSGVSDEYCEKVAKTAMTALMSYVSTKEASLIRSGKMSITVV